MQTDVASDSTSSNAQFDSLSTNFMRQLSLS